MTILVTGGAGFIGSNFVLNWKPAETFETGICKTVQWYLDNQGWVDKVTGGEYSKWVEKQYA